MKLYSQFSRFSPGASFNNNNQVGVLVTAICLDLRDSGMAATNGHALLGTLTRVETFPSPAEPRARTTPRDFAFISGPEADFVIEPVSNVAICLVCLEFKSIPC